MRVGFVVASSTSYRQLESLVPMASARGVEIVPIALDDGSGPLRARLAAVGGRLHGVGAPGAWRGLPAAARRLGGLARELELDLLHSNLFWPSLAVELGRGIRRHPPSVLCRHHNRQHHLDGKAVHVRLDALAARSATRVVAVSAAVRATLLDEGVRPDKVDVVHNGFDWASCAPDPDGVLAWRERFPGRRIAVAVGRLDPIKDLPTVVDAFAALADRHPDLVLVVAGSGPDGERRALAARAADRGVAERVHLVGHVDRVFDLLGASDVFLQASLDESFGQTVVEAMATGVPIAVTSGGAIPEIVGPGVPTVPVGDAEALARLADDHLAAGTAAREEAAGLADAVRDRFSIERLLDGYLRTYEVAFDARRR